MRDTFDSQHPITRWMLACKTHLESQYLVLFGGKNQKKNKGETLLHSVLQLPMLWSPPRAQFYLIKATLITYTLVHGAYYVKDRDSRPKV